jgi:hypothetical protein
MLSQLIPLVFGASKKLDMEFKTQLQQKLIVAWTSASSQIVALNPLLCAAEFKWTGLLALLNNLPKLNREAQHQLLLKLARKVINVPEEYRGRALKMIRKHAARISRVCSSQVARTLGLPWG